MFICHIVWLFDILVCFYLWYIIWRFMTVYLQCFPFSGILPGIWCSISCDIPSGTVTFYLVYCFLRHCLKTFFDILYCILWHPVLSCMFSGIYSDMLFVTFFWHSMLLRLHLALFRLAYLLTFCCPWEGIITPCPNKKRLPTVFFGGAVLNGSWAKDLASEGYCRRAAKGMCEEDAISVSNKSWHMFKRFIWYCLRHLSAIFFGLSI